MRTVGFFIYDLYNYFFNVKVNPLRFIPDPMTRFILMFYLSVAWTAVFTLGIGGSLYFGIGSVGAHLLVIGMFFMTATIFIDAEKNGHLWVKSRRKLVINENRSKCVWDLEKEA